MYLDFYRIFAKASQSIPVANMKKYELEIKGVGNLLNSHTQRMAVSDQWLSGRTFLMVVPQSCYCQHLKNK